MISKSHTIGIFYIVISAIGWSTAGFFTRGIALDSWTILFWRGLFGGVFILIIAYRYSGLTLKENFSKLGWPGWAVCFISAGGMIAFINSFYHTTVANTSIIYATIPFVSALLAWQFLREKPDVRTIGYSLLAFAGVLVVVGNGSWGGGLFGDFLAFLMTLALASMLVLIKKYQDIPMMFACGLSSLLCAIFIMPFADLVTVSSFDMGWLLVFAIVQTALGLIFFTMAAKRLAPAQCALISTLETPLAPLWVWLAFNEIPASATMIGGSIVMFAVIAYLGGNLRVSKLLARQQAAGD